ncbi:MAG: hypothetical protein DRJ03_12015 [Chloroflexi bacterium]|nr:MAG: hypothetical protein DRJ03_12015 [Chloroflexota bacterium]
MQKSDQWVEDRELLRMAARENDESGLDATVLYCLISHMRGKRHMHTYAKHHGGWRLTSREYGPHWYAVDSLDDQAEFLRKYEDIAMDAGNPRFREAVQRIIYDGYNIKETPLQETSLSA